MQQRLNTAWQSTWQFVSYVAGATINYLLSSPEKDRELIETLTNIGGDRTEWVARLLRQRASANARTQDSKNTALSLAISKQSASVVEILLFNKADPNQADADGRSPLEVLLTTPAPFARYYPDPTKQKQQDDQLLSRLLYYKADPNNTVGGTLLKRVLDEGNEPMLTALVEAKADLEYRDRFGNTWLESAIKDNKLQQVGLLLAANANVNNNAPAPPLYRAIKSTQFDIAEKLLEANAVFDKLCQEHLPRSSSLRVGADHPLLAAAIASRTNPLHRLGQPASGGAQKNTESRDQKGTAPALEWEGPPGGPKPGLWQDAPTAGATTDTSEAGTALDGPDERGARPEPGLQ